MNKKPSNVNFRFLFQDINPMAENRKKGTAPYF